VVSPRFQWPRENGVRRGIQHVSETPQNVPIGETGSGITQIVPRRLALMSAPPTLKQRAVVRLVRW
jgi:hypothetical protein